MPVTTGQMFTLARSLQTFLAILAATALHLALAMMLVMQTPVANIQIPRAVQLVKLAAPKPEPEVQPIPSEPAPAPQRVAPPPPKAQAQTPPPRPRPIPQPVAKPVAKPAPPPVEAPIVQTAEPAAPPAPQPRVTQAQAQAAPPPATSAPPQPSYQPVDVGVAYLNNPKPTYPRIAQRRGWEGTVVLLLDLDENGQPLRVQIANSSGYNALDKAAQSTVERWRFQPATRDGRAVSADNVRVPIEFRLRDG